MNPLSREKQRYDNILQTIGDTPVVRINKLAPEGRTIYVKCESFNPMSSVKDRMAWNILEEAERAGALKPGQTVVEATSGNTGIGLAMACAVKGYPLVLTMAESFSVERRKILRFLGAKVVLTPAELKGSGMLEKAVELAETHGWFLCRQFENEANADAHVQSTALEILRDFEGDRLDYFVTGYGTGGTLKGTGRILKEKRPDINIMVCEPDNSALLLSGIPQARNEAGAVSESHPMFRPHLMQGWTPDFIPKLTEDAVDLSIIKDIVPINGGDAMDMTRALAQQEGIFTGVSGGATFSGAMKVARQAEEGSVILCMLPDTGERYLSTPLFDNISVEMTQEEIEISKSTPNYRFDVRSAPPPAPAAAAPEEPPALDPEAVAFYEATIGNKDKPVVLFALEWCEFCWSVRKLFGMLDVPYVAVDLDSVAYQENDRGGKLRAVLKDRLGVPTIPQIFVGGEHVGGATDTMGALSSGKLGGLFDKYGVSFTAPDPDFEPRSLLPNWLHKR